MTSRESRMLLKPLATEAALVSVLVSFATVRERPRKTRPGRSSRSQTALTYRERPQTWKACWQLPAAHTCMPFTPFASWAVQPYGGPYVFVPHRRSKARAILVHLPPK